MKLDEFLRREEITQEAFGKKLGLTQGRVSQIIRNGTNSLRVATKIEKLSGGRVSTREVMKLEAAE